jgi:hypothetical protein
MEIMEFSYKYCKQIIPATAILCNVCAISIDLEPEYFDGSNGDALRFLPSPIHVYNSLYPLDRIICLRCKEKSNGAMTLEGQVVAGTLM